MSHARMTEVSKPPEYAAEWFGQHESIAVRIAGRALTQTDLILGHGGRVKGTQKWEVRKGLDEVN